MLRTMMQIYIKNSKEAVAFYENVFGAKIDCCYYNENGTISHAELNIFGQIFAICETLEDTVATGNSMQFCFHFGEGNQDVVKKIINELSIDAKNISQGPTDWTPIMADITDKFGVRFCIFV